jgi:hypothetical protein
MTTRSLAKGSAKAMNELAEPNVTGCVTGMRKYTPQLFSINYPACIEYEMFKQYELLDAEVEGALVELRLLGSPQ